ncbi:hypothetical protein AruPA_03910 [Acidiphilium sp. PA]|uniref:hypothetical protein n=1 Tax=Acidiphilium sp. PA TaxID=2871705 RepID=UPI002243C849|nr:hypothetical protein [Acidiphilium sp. PA]MCW8306171.1 hypothetical protein [Acidiphilium sp. PA]
MIPPFGCLRGVKQFGAERSIEVVERRLRQLLTPILETVDVNEEYYRKMNPDVDEKIKAGELKSAKAHYTLAGYYEDRLPRPIIVDETWYLTEYPDVAEAVARKYFISATQHFNLEGFREGRLPAAGWTLASDPPRPNAVRDPFRVDKLSGVPA